MALTTEEKQKTTAGLMRIWSQRFEELADVSKIDIYQAVNATDGWIEDNAASFNSALPATPRTNLNAEQKTFVFLAVAAMRQGLDYSRRVLGEVD